MNQESSGIVWCVCVRVCMRDVGVHNLRCGLGDHDVTNIGTGKSGCVVKH